VIPALALALALAVALPAAAAPPRLNSISPKWLRLGETNYVMLAGENLASVSRLIVADTDGITVEPSPSEGLHVALVSEDRNLFKDPQAADDKHLRVKIVVPPDASFNPRQLRVVTPDGVSNPLMFDLSDLPQVASPDDNDSPAKAFEVALPAVIAGVIRGGDGQYFRFAAQKEKRLLFDVDASRSGSQLDSSMALLDSSGKEVARNEDANGLDSFIDFVAPEDGTYTIQLRDFRQRSGGDYKFRLTAGELPYLDGIFPYGAKRGMPVSLALRGRNLQGDSTLYLTLNPKARLGRQEIRERVGRYFTNPQNFDVSDYAEFNESEPNNDPLAANEVSPPVNINGKIGSERDTDAFRFKVDKGQRLIFEVFASRFGSPLDALLTLMETNGNVIEHNDDAVGADSRIDHTFDKAGVYAVSIRDLLNRGGPDFGYRLSIHPPPPPALSAKILDDDIRVNRDGRVGIRVEVVRAGFGGPVEVRAMDLSQGVLCPPIVVEEGLSAGWLEFNASTEALLGSFPLKVQAATLMGSKPVRRVADFAPGDRAVKDGFLTVLPQSPFSVEWRSMEARLEQQQSATLYFSVKRRPGFAKEVKLSLQGFSAGREGVGPSVDVQPVTLKGDQSDGEFNLRAKIESEVGRRSIWIKAESGADGDQITQYSPVIPLTITEFPFLLTTSLPRLTVTAVPEGSKSEAGEAEFSVKVVRRGLFTDEITLAVEGVPDGITLAPTNLLHNVGEALLRLTADDEAEPGKTNRLTVVGTANVNGRKFVQRAPVVELIVNTPTAPMEAPLLTTNAPSSSK
jgi:hypothetical protein